MKPDPLYLTEGEIAARVGMTTREWDAVAPKLELAGLPVPDPLFHGRRYWPAVVAYLDRRNGLHHAQRSETGVVPLGPRRQGSFK